MRVFAHKQDQFQPRASFINKRSDVTPVKNNHPHEIDSDSVVITRFAHDFSRIPVYAKKAENVGENVSALDRTKAPAIVRDTLSSSGQPLDPTIRAFMEPRYGHDFSRVRIHTDERAAKSARGIGAAAYTLGSHIAFASGHYQPRSVSGSALLAHELAHVVQQKNTSNFSRTLPDIGSASDQTERQADVVADAVMATTHMPHAQAARYIPHLSAPSFPSPVLRRAPIETWGGKFDNPQYDLSVTPGKGATRFGTDTQITFEPNDKVDAEKIALVQTAQTLLHAAPHYINAASNPKDVTESRSIQSGIGEGTHIDSSSSSKTPLFGIKDPKAGSDLAAADPNPRLTRLGFPKEKDVNKRTAWIFDPAGFAVPDSSEASQIFETTALAIAGVQKGTYYGSVQWGWAKSSNEPTAKKIDFRLKSKDAPSSYFSEAAKLWNASQTETGDATIDLPIAAGMYTNIKKSALMNNPVKPISLGNIDQNTRLQVTNEADPTNGNWRKVIVMDGGLTGKIGWVKKDILAEGQTKTKRKK